MNSNVTEREKQRRKAISEALTAFYATDKGMARKEEIRRLQSLRMINLNKLSKTMKDGKEN